MPDKTIGGDTTPSIEELEAALEAAKAARRKTDAERREAQDKAWSVLSRDPASWEWRSTPSKSSRFFDEPPQEGLRIECCIRPELLEAWRAGGPANITADASEGRWLGMFYIRTEEGILTQGEGGGRVVLNTPMLCNDEEWAGLELGLIPLKYQRWYKQG